MKYNVHLTAFKRYGHQIRQVAEMDILSPLACKALINEQVALSQSQNAGKPVLGSEEKNGLSQGVAN